MSKFDYADIELRVLAESFEQGQTTMSTNTTTPTININISVSSAEDALKVAELAKIADKVLRSKYVTGRQTETCTTATRNTYIFDTDGVIADDKHRLHYIRPAKNKCAKCGVEQDKHIGTHYGSVYIREVQCRSDHEGHRCMRYKAPFRNWNGYFKHMAEDTPIESTVTLIRTLSAAGNRIVILTGRPEKYRDVTTQWFKDNNVPFDDLIMRPEHNFKVNAVLKEELLHQHIERNRFINVVGVFEDNPEAVEMYRKHKLPVFQIPNPDAKGSAA